MCAIFWFWGCEFSGLIVFDWCIFPNLAMDFTSNSAFVWKQRGPRVLQWEMSSKWQFTIRRWFNDNDFNKIRKNATKNFPFISVKKCLLDYNILYNRPHINNKIFLVKLLQVLITKSQSIEFITFLIYNQGQKVVDFSKMNEKLPNKLWKPLFARANVIFIGFGEFGWHVQKPKPLNIEGYEFLQSLQAFFGLRLKVQWVLLYNFFEKTSN